MKTIIDILTELFVDYKEITRTETIGLFEISINVIKANNFDVGIAQNVKDIVSSKDVLTIGININESFYSFDFTSGDNLEFIESWNQAVSPEENDVFSFVLRIEKDHSISGPVSLYDSFTFFQYLEKLDILDFIGIFNDIFVAGANSPCFILIGNQSILTTLTLHFGSIESASFSKISYAERLKILDKQVSVSHFTSISNLAVIPDDFFILEFDEKFPLSVRHKFEQACFVTSIAAIFDYTNLDGSNLTVRLNGYKSSRNVIPIESINREMVKTYYDIYAWVYQNGGLHDKIGLARNLISLHFENGDGHTLSKSVFSSIVSGYKVYEKQNVKQYIELRNRMSDHLISYNEKASKITESFASSFQKSALTFVTLFSSIVVVRSLTTGSISGAFSFNAVILSLAFLFCSFLYFLASLWEINQQKKRFDNSYKQMRNRNEDLLTVEDIDRILNNDSEHIDNLKYISSRRCIYSSIWLGSIFIFFVSVIYLKDRRSGEQQKSSASGGAILDIKSDTLKIDGKNWDSLKIEEMEKESKRQFGP
ncbi:hypothetical protein [Flavihumibacter sp. CACIAM 22H1]|uniref:hypothetical protein n=1 Tax=Flavihumibacter sp. CACIAM 22H1 TaxID=1812911 RepID=UPI0007A86E13|nr:hypothetical protein [Flavihumibacter sp. CACIAM 22H1]KYP16168.1 MAG: hypothetical protein A1D16_13975 [Flavihumibacter sp. CACIAM 22H1]